MDKLNSNQYSTVDRENEALMQPGVVSAREFKLFAGGVEEIYGPKTTKAAQEVIKILNGLTIEQANTALDLARHKLKRLCKLEISPDLLKLL